MVPIQWLRQDPHESLAVGYQHRQCLSLTYRFGPMELDWIVEEGTGFCTL